MFYFAQVNIGIDISTILGIFQSIFGLVYFVFLLYILLKIGKRLSVLSLILYIIQLILLPLFLVLSGFILFIQGWRLDPILQFQQFIISTLLFYFSLKDLFNHKISRN